VPLPSSFVVKKGSNIFHGWPRHTRAVSETRTARNVRLPETEGSHEFPVHVDHIRFYDEHPSLRHGVRAFVTRLKRIWSICDLSRHHNRTLSGEVVERSMSSVSSLFNSFCVARIAS
jgi:hypothetical protein